MLALFNRYRNGLTSFSTSRFNLPGWCLLAIVSYAIARALQFWLDASYAASQFPVPFYTGQTTFNAAELKSYYEVLLEKGTMDIYIRTQLIDYVFMLGTFVSFFCLSSAVMRSLKHLSLAKWITAVALFFVWFSPLAAVMDALENLVSFVMLSNPEDFANWLVYPYSGFAVIKFGIFALSYLWYLLAVLLVLCMTLYNGVARATTRA